MNIQEFEIMAPVGSRESLAAAIQAGADSVYFGIGQLNMRSHSANHFTIEDLKEIAETCKARGIKTYLTVNTVIYGEDLSVMREIIDAAKQADITAAIVSDVAVMVYCRQVGLEVHLSTQLNISNIEALKFYAQFADVAVDSTGKVFGSSIPLSGTAPIRQPMPNAAQRPVEAPGAALRQSGGEVHARPERAPQNAVEGRNAPARPAPIQKPAAKPVQNEQPPVSPVQPVVQQMVAEEKENMDTLPAGKVEENAPNMELPVPSREVTLDSSPKQDDVSEQPTASVFQSDEPEELPVAPVVQQEAPDQPVAPSYTESTPVEDILKVMTFEEAQNVVVDSGLSKGKTMATVAKERPVSLKFYLTPGNKSTNNIVRAAAQIMLDGMAAQKAG